MKKFLVFLLMVLGLSLIASLNKVHAAVPGDVPDQTAWVFNNRVNDIQVDSNYIYYAGSFTYTGMNRPSLALVNSTDGMLDTMMPDANGIIRAVVSDGSGGYYIGGEFTRVGTFLTNGVAHIQAGGTVDESFDLSLDYNVNAMAISGTDLYIGGNFTSVDGQVRNRVAKIDTLTGTVDGTWNPNANGVVQSLVIDGTDIFVGGYFTNIGGQARARIAKLNNTNGNASVSWDPGANNTVNTLTVNGGYLYTGGEFNYIASTSRNRLVRLNTSDGALDTVWNPNPGNFVYSVVVSGGYAYAGGLFTTIGGASRAYIAKLDLTNGTADASWNPAANAQVNSIDISGDDIYAGGNFTTIGGQTRYYTAKLNNTNGNADTTWDPIPNYYVNSVKIDGTKILLGGSFGSINGYRRSYLVRFNKTTKALDVNWNPNPSGAISKMQISGGYVYVAGTFNTIGGQSRNGFAKISTATGAVDLTWNPAANSIQGVDIVISGSDVYVSGAFTSIGGQTRNRLAKLNNTNGNADATWDPAPNSSVSKIGIDGVNIYVIGSFTSIGGQTRNRIAKLNNTNGNADGTWDANSDGSISFLFVTDTYIYVSGYFSSIGGLSRNYFARLNNTTAAADASFNPNPDQLVRAMIQISNDLYIGGSFTNIGGSDRGSIAKLSVINGTLDTTWDPDIDWPGDGYGVFAIQNDNLDIYTGGSFGVFQGLYASQNAAKLSADLYQITTSNGIVPVLNNGVSVEAGSDMGSSSPNEYVLLKKNNMLLAGVTVDMSQDRDWVSVNGQADLLSSKSVVINLNPVDSPGALAVHAIYVPKRTTDTTVGVCPDAITLADVKIGCSGFMIKTEADADTEIVILGGRLYWKISGLHGTGGISIGDSFLLSDQMTRLQANVLSDHDIRFGTIGGLVTASDYFILYFDRSGTAFDLGSIAIGDIDLMDDGSQLTLEASSGASTWGVDISNTFGTITFTAPVSGSGYISDNSVMRILIGTNATGGSNQITNPAAIGSYKIEMEIFNTGGEEDGEISIPIVDSDQVNITGYVNNYIIFDIDTGTGTDDPIIDCGFTECLIHSGGSGGSNYTVDLGELKSLYVNKSQDASVMHSDGNPGTINSIYLDLTSNAISGSVVTVSSANEALNGPGTNTIPTVTDGNNIIENSGLYGFTLPVAGSALHGTVVRNSSCTSLTTYCGPTTTPKLVFNTSGEPIDTARVRMDLAAAAAYTDNPGTYTDTLTFIATGTF